MRFLKKFSKIVSMVLGLIMVFAVSFSTFAFGPGKMQILRGSDKGIPLYFVRYQERGSSKAFTVHEYDAKTRQWNKDFCYIIFEDDDHSHLPTLYRVEGEKWTYVCYCAHDRSRDSYGLYFDGCSLGEYFRKTRTGRRDMRNIGHHRCWGLYLTDYVSKSNGQIKRIEVVASDPPCPHVRPEYTCLAGEGLSDEDAHFIVYLLSRAGIFERY